jgi:flagellar basal-body rod modification protein FlgD
MNYKIFFTSLLLVSLSYLPAQASCREGNLRSTEYIRRNQPNRCEGIQREPISGNSLRLISIAIRNIPSYGETLIMQIPRINDGSNPQVKLQSLDKNYQLDSPSLSPNSSGYSFSWDTYVLKKEKIPADSLRALAYFNLGSESVHIPVILGETSGKYEFVFYTPSRAKFSTFEILRDGKRVYSSPLNNARSGEIVFNWDGRNAPAGRYELHIVANIEPIRQPAQRFERRFFFEHDPNWLK